MTWAKLDDAMGEHRKVRRAMKQSRTAVAFHFLGILHCAKYLTDGHVEAEFVSDLCDDMRVRPRERDTAVEVLVRNGLWDEHDESGWWIHGYLEHNPSRAEVLAKRAKDAERKARGRASQSEGSPRGLHEDSAGSPTGVRAVSDGPVPTRPDPSTKTPTESDPEVLRLSRLLLSQMRQTDPKAKGSPESKAWTDPIRLLMERDERTPEQVEYVIRWLATDDFWSGVVLSPASLRSKFTQLVAAIQRGRGKPATASRNADIEDWLNATGEAA